MKLLNRYNRVHIISALIIVVLSSFVYYSIIRTILLMQIDKDLKVEEEEILDYVKLNKALPPASDYKHQQIKFERLSDRNQVVRREIIDTIEAIASETQYGTQYMPYRRLSFPLEVNGSHYKAIVYKSEVESEYLLRLIVSITGILLLVLFTVIFLVNRFVLGKLWQPFFYTLRQLKDFDLSSRKPLKLPNSSIEEFHELNQSVTQMTHRVTKEFESLKQFTENASHEIQTPLAIIRSKLDLLIQSCNEEQADQLQSIYNATERLTKLNQNLLLLTKIGNNQYEEQEILNFKQLVETKFLQFDELIKSRRLQVSLSLGDLRVSLNKDLADILLNNLISNAIKHNENGGMIICRLNGDEFMISNTGTEVALSKDQIFNRFHKGSDSKGIGLGLAVVKEICDALQIQISYSFEKLHHIHLRFHRLK